MESAIVPGRLAQPAVTREEPGPGRPGEEAQILGVRLVGHGQPGLGGDLPDLRLGQLSEREAEPTERVGGERGEHVGLILCAIDGDAQERSGWVLLVGDPRVVPGGEGVSAEVLGELEHRVEADVAVAADARVGRLALRRSRR